MVLYIFIFKKYPRNATSGSKKVTSGWIFQGYMAFNLMQEDPTSTKMYVFRHVTHNNYVKKIFYWTKGLKSKHVLYHLRFTSYKKKYTKNSTLKH